jgi:hypothetical protein
MENDAMIEQCCYMLIDCIISNAAQVFFVAICRKLKKGKAINIKKTIERMTNIPIDRKNRTINAEDT